MIFTCHILLESINSRREFMFKNISVFALVGVSAVVCASPISHLGQKGLHNSVDPVFTLKTISVRQKTFPLQHVAMYAGPDCQHLTLKQHADSDPQCYTDPICKADPSNPKCTYNCDYAQTGSEVFTSAQLVTLIGSGQACIGLDTVPQPVEGNRMVQLVWDAKSASYTSAIPSSITATY
jgi:hypothetical protein